MRQPRRTLVSLAAAQAALLSTGFAWGQAATAPGNAASAPAATPQKIEAVVISGQRAALQSAQKIKQDADEIVDSIVADDIGKLPDKSVTEVLQRIPGVTIDRTLNRVDPQQGVGDGIMHFAAEGTGVSVRGLSYVRSELNGRDSFSANGGRSLSFEDVPPELMSGVDVYKNPSAEQIEGAIGGLVNLRTALPFDYQGPKLAFSAETSRSQLRGKSAPSFSALLSNRWNTDLGQVGALVDVAQSKLATHSDGLSISPYFPRRNAVVGDTSGELRWITPGGAWTSNDFDRQRQGLYGALQWRKGNLSSSLTYFKSRYKMHTSEDAFFLGTNPNTLTVDAGATFDEHGALVKGVLRAPTEGVPAPDPTNAKGIGFGTDARDSGRTADSRDISWNLAWKASDRLTLSSDLQHIRASTDGFDYTVGTGGFMPKQTVDLSGSLPRFSFDAADRAYLADPSHYYWGFAQEHRDHSVATERAWRGDAKYVFDDPVLRDLRFGIRVTQRWGETRSTHDSEWAQISQGWAVGNDWQPLKQLAWLSDPRMNHDVHLKDFGSKFFNGKVPTPAPVLVPDNSLVTGFPGSFEKLHGYTQLVCKATCSWTPAPYGDDKGLNEQSEHTQAAYSQLRFGFDDLPYPVDGNFGVRLVRTDSTSVGYTFYTPSENPRPDVPYIPKQSESQAFEHRYTNILPSLNLRMKTSEQMQYRFALSRGMTRPDLWQMQAYTTLSQNVNTHSVTGPDGKPMDVVDSVTYTGSARGNPLLLPTMSNNVDLSAEYYFGKTSSLTLAMFNKQVRDIIIGKTSYYQLSDTSGQPHDFSITSPINGAKGRASGFELGYQQYFDKLPGWLSGFGVSGNYTYIDSRLKMYSPVTAVWCTPSGSVQANLIRDLNGCDTDGRVLGGVPLTGLSKNAFNLALLYDYGPISARVAYSWRSKYLQAVNAYGTAGGDGIDQNPDSPNRGNSYSASYALPTWGGAYGQVDMGVHYKVDDHLSLAVEGQNLNDAIYKQYMQQGIGLKERAAFASGRRYTIQMRYTY